MRLNITYSITRNDKTILDYDSPREAMSNFEKIARDADKDGKRVFCNLNFTNKYIPSGSIVVGDNIYYQLISVIEEPDPLYTSPYYTTNKKTTL